MSPKQSILIPRNISTSTGRAAMRLPPRMLQAMKELCRREGITEGQLVEAAQAALPTAPRTQAVETYVFAYFLDAATAEGHAAAGHGDLHEVVS
jgi:hypothetical protein